MKEEKQLDTESLFSDYEEHLSFTEKYFGLSTMKALGAFIVVVCAGLYISLLLFGDNSVNVMLDLESKKDKISADVTSLKKENAQLQKEYFELLELNSQ